MLENSSRDRFALITGCGPGGIGQALCLEFLKQGFVVIATILPGETRTHLELEHCHVQYLDVTSDNSAKKLLTFVDGLTDGKLDILANNAGICYQYPAVDYETQMVEELFAVNVLGPIRMVRYFHRLLVSAQGVIFNTCSVAGVFPTVYQAAYCATKAALSQYGNTLRVELAPLGVRVVNVISGEVDTNILRGDLHRKINPDSVYSPLSTRFEESLKRSNPRMDPHVYAKGVVQNALRPKPKALYWRGTWSRSIWAIDRFMPKQSFDYLAAPMYHLDELKPVAARRRSLLNKMIAPMIRQG